MAAFRPPDGLEKLGMITAALLHEVRTAIFRRRVATLTLGFFAAIFITLVLAETLFATLMFSIISVEILGHVVSGAAFALLVPTVIGAAHVKLHYESDHFTRWWLKKLSGIGLLVFILGMSSMVGFSAWRAASEAVSAISTGPTGTLGNQQVSTAPEPSTGIADWIGIIPNGLLFLGLSFGMIITIYFASFCLGRALQSFNLLTQTPPVSKEVEASCYALKEAMIKLRTARDEDEAARWKMPLDLKHRFAREASNACWKITQNKLGAARRKFDPMRLNDPLAMAFNDADIATIPNQFNNEESFCRHMADQMDGLRLHSLIRVLTGLPEHGEQK